MSEPADSESYQMAKALEKICERLDDLTKEVRGVRDSLENIRSYIADSRERPEQKRGLFKRDGRSRSLPEVGSPWAFWAGS